MNVLLWVLQGLLALHTATGAVWKFSNSEQAVPSLNAIPHGAWVGLAVVELFWALDLILPALVPRLAIAVPIAAGFIAAEMLVFTGIHLLSGDPNYGPVYYWLVVALFSAFIVYGRLALRPIA